MFFSAGHHLKKEEPPRVPRPCHLAAAVALGFTCPSSRWSRDWRLPRACRRARCSSSRRSIHVAAPIVLCSIARCRPHDNQTAADRLGNASLDEEPYADEIFDSFETDELEASIISMSSDETGALMDANGPGDSSINISVALYALCRSYPTVDTRPREREPRQRSLFYGLSHDTPAPTQPVHPRRAQATVHAALESARGVCSTSSLLTQIEPIE